MNHLSDGIALLIIYIFWASCLLFGARFMVTWIWSPLDLINIDWKCLFTGLGGAALVLVALTATRK